MPIRLVSSLTLLLVVSSSLAQNKPATEYPQDAVALGAEAIKQRLTGQVFSATPANGGTWRFEFKDSGYMFFNVGAYSDSGKWRIEGNQWCTELGKAGLGCSELREKDGQLYYKSPKTGEILQLQSR